MHQQPLDFLPLWLVLVIVFVLSGLAMEWGYRLGKRCYTQNEEEKATPIGAIVGSILGLFAFMLAFTFGMAANRFEAKRQAVLDEANAIGTTYLRSRLLHEPHRSESARLLREYVDVRLEGAKAGKTEQVIRRSEELHDLLWVQAVKEAEGHPSPLTSLYLQSLNETIDLHASRVQVAIRNRIPTSIWMGLIALALLSMASVGYQAGLSATRRSPAMLGLLLAFGSVLFLIADLDRGQEGFLRVSQQALVDLQSSMSQDQR